MLRRVSASVAAILPQSSVAYQRVERARFVLSNGVLDLLWSKWEKFLWLLVVHLMSLLLALFSRVRRWCCFACVCPLPEGSSCDGPNLWLLRSCPGDGSVVSVNCSSQVVHFVHTFQCPSSWRCSDVHKSAPWCSTLGPAHSVVILREHCFAEDCVRMSQGSCHDVRSCVVAFTVGFVDLLLTHFIMLCLLLQTVGRGEWSTVENNEFECQRD